MGANAAAYSPRKRIEITSSGARRATRQHRVNTTMLPSRTDGNIESTQARLYNDKLTIHSAPVSSWKLGFREHKRDFNNILQMLDLH